MKKLMRLRFIERGDRMEVVVETKKFLDILNVARLGGELDKAQLIFEPDGLRINVVNPANTLGCYARFEPEYFSGYNVKKEAKFALPLFKLLKIIRQVGGSELKMNVKKDRVVFNDGAIEAPVVAYSDDIEMSSAYKFIETEFGGLLLSDESKLDSYSYTRIQIPKKINLLDVENLVFIAENNLLAVYQEDDLGHKIKNTISSMMDKFAGDARVIVDATLLKFAFDTLIGAECYIAIGVSENGSPLPVQLCDSASNYVTCLVVAPKLQSD